jgi:DNA-binding LytR/AlgR family response regulator
MILKLEQDLGRQDIEVLIKYGERNEEVERLVSLVHSAEKRVLCHTATGEKTVGASSIYYIESVNKKSFVYGEQYVYQTKFRLYQLLKELANAGFVQISKYCILNVNVLDAITPLANSRMEATLIDGRRLLVTRKYLGLIKQALLKGNYT